MGVQNPIIRTTTFGETERSVRIDKIKRYKIAHGDRVKERGKDSGIRLLMNF